MKTVLSKNISELRKQRNLTQPELAKILGLSMASIRSYENGLREPNSKAMVALESFFNVSGEFLRGEIDHKTFYESNDILQTELDNLICIFSDFKKDFSICSQENQKIIVCALSSTLKSVSDNILHAENIVDVDLYLNLLKAFFTLNAEGQKELLKRADELQQLPKYSL